MKPAKNVPLSIRLRQMKPKRQTNSPEVADVSTLDGCCLFSASVLPYYGAGTSKADETNEIDHLPPQLRAQLASREIKESFGLICVFLSFNVIFLVCGTEADVAAGD